MDSSEQRPAPSAATPLRELLAGDVVRAAAGLIGCVLARRLPACEPGLPSNVLRARIVECEAYHMRERGCHAFRGRTPRNEVMFGPPGRLYVYFTYGMWHCANVVCEPAGVAAAVLLRAAQPLPDRPPGTSPALSRATVPTDEEPGFTNAVRLSGPGLLCQGLRLDRRQNGANVLDRRGEVWLYRPADYTPPPLTWTTRIGFSFADELPWRCCWTGHPALSRKA